MKSLAIIHLFALSLFLTSAFGAENQPASDSGRSPWFDYQKKASGKASSRWTLQEWLAMKDRNRMMDLWLGMYAPSPYEFYLGGTSDTYKTVQTSTDGSSDRRQSFRSYSGTVGAYALIMGLVGEHQNNVAEKYSDTTGSLNIRVLGNAVQGTHLILNYGLRTRYSTEHRALPQQFAGADLDLYVMKYFGIHGNYRGFIPMEHVTLGKVTGQRSEAGLFIDFGALRIFGNWFAEQSDQVLPSGEIHRDQTGLQSGLKIFF